MIPEAGQISLMLAFVLSMIQGLVVLFGVIRRDDRLMALAKPATHLNCLSVVTAYACLTYAFVTSDFSVRYVAEHSNTLLPMFYKVAAVWGGHEGSMLLWALILALWSLAVSLFSRNLPRETVAAVLAVMGLLTVGFLAFLIFASNPFERIFPALAEGRDLNPLLQDPGMVFHPPMLYMGYVGFSVAFSFAIAALILGRLDATWARWSRPWTTIAWVFLTLGIALGSWWAYYELGWGGWWFWDPVENASFMPWLVGTALIHSLAVTEKRGSFKNWTVMLAILAFSLSLLGTFLVRSGVLTSVHAFATDPKRGIFILSFLSITIGLSFWLFAWRAGKVSRGGAFELVSREALLLVNNLLLTVAAASVLLGTLYPLLLDALGMGKISVGPPYFEAVFVPLMIPLFLVIGVGPFLHWRKSRWGDLPPQLKWMAAAVLGIAVLVPFLLGRWSLLVAVGLALGVWSIASSFGTVHWRGQARELSLYERTRLVTRAQWGMILAHAGIGVVILGITLVKGYETAVDVKMSAGTTATVGEYVFDFKSSEEVKGPNYVAMRGHLEVYQEGRKVVDLYPEKRVYTVQRMPMTEAAIDSGMFRDLYVSLGEPVGIQTWIVRIQHKPLVGWIWWGCVLMALGGLLAASDRRYKLARRPSSEPARSMTGEFGSA